jgi:coproporphyrinogen III oxidase-like Fe-S oxidoreductase
MDFNRRETAFPLHPDPHRYYLLYVHIPFCKTLCPYCSFTRVQFEEHLALSFFKALRREIESYSTMGFNFHSVYIGGGTPTILPDSLIEIISLITSLWNIREISVETNPNALTPSITTLLKEAGVNRLSVGVQTFDDTLLKTIGRYHKYGSGTEIEERIEETRNIFDTLNIDMIFNLPGQTRTTLDADLETLINLEPDQVTYYPLMNAGPARMQLQDLFGKAAHRKERSFYQVITDRLRPFYFHATAWCFTKTAGMIDEYITREEEYVGSGAGAFGYVNGTLYANTCSVERYIGHIQSGESPLFGSRRFPRYARMHYTLLMHLFEGRVSPPALEYRHGRIASLLLPFEIALLSLIGAATRQGAYVCITEKGRYLLVVLMREFFTAVNRLREICRKGPERPRVGRN